MGMFLTKTPLYVGVFVRFGMEVAAYRIALESFTNIIKHAEASACQIKVKIENRSLLLEISDNGKGFSAGVGRTSMQERAAELGGECIIENIPTCGARVSARLPIRKE